MDWHLFNSSSSSHTPDISTHYVECLDEPLAQKIGIAFFLRQSHE